MKIKYIGNQLNKFNQIIDLSKSSKLFEGFNIQL